MVLFLWSIISDWQDENERTKKLGSQVWENLCSLYSRKYLRLASEKLVLASGSNLSLATGLASWKVSLEPWKIFKFDELFLKDILQWKHLIPGLGFISV